MRNLGTTRNVWTNERQETFLGTRQELDAIAKENEIREGKHFREADLKGNWILEIPIK